MLNRQKKPFLFLISALGFFLSACIEEQLPEKLSVDLRGKEAVFIVNEGNYLSANASVTVYLPQSGEVIQEFFLRVNGGQLGDVAQSLAFFGDDGFLVVNNSQVIYRFDRFSGQFKSAISGFVSPRYMAFASKHKAFVSDLYAEKIYTINPQASVISGAIDIENPTATVSQHNAEQLLLTDQYLFASAWSFDNKVLVIDRYADTLITKLEVGNQPKHLVLDRNQKLWVMCDGGISSSGQPLEESRLYRINAQTFKTEIIYFLQALPTARPARGGAMALSPQKDSLYFLYDDLWKIPVAEFGLPGSPVVPSEGRLLYTLAVSPSGELYLADALDYLQRGQIYRYTAAGKLLDQFEAGIIPGFIAFNKD